MWQLAMCELSDTAMHCKKTQDKDFKIYSSYLLEITGDLTDVHFDMFQVQDRSINPCAPMVSPTAILDGGTGAGSPIPSGAVGCSDLFHSDCWQKSSTMITDWGLKSCARAGK